MARYIDADALLSRLPDDLPYKGSVKRVLLQAPTSDIVVMPCRCSECRHLVIVNKEPIYAECKKQNVTFLLWEADTREHCCSYGERKE